MWLKWSKVQWEIHCWVGEVVWHHICLQGIKVSLVAAVCSELCRCWEKSLWPVLPGIPSHDPVFSVWRSVSQTQLRKWKNCLLSSLWLTSLFTFWLTESCIVFVIKVLCAHRFYWGFIRSKDAMSTTQTWKRQQCDATSLHQNETVVSSFLPILQPRAEECWEMPVSGEMEKEGATKAMFFIGSVQQSAVPFLVSPQVSFPAARLRRA